LRDERQAYGPQMVAERERLGAVLLAALADTKKYRDNAVQLRRRIEQKWSRLRDLCLRLGHTPSEMPAAPGWFGREPQPGDPKDPMGAQAFNAIARPEMSDVDRLVALLAQAKRPDRR
jgi:hypothetical protein